MNARWTTGLLVLLTSNIGYAQTDAWSAIVCNKNNTNNTIALEMKSIGACSPGSSAAGKAAAAVNNNVLKQQIAGNVGGIVGGIVNYIGQSDNDVVPPQPDPAALRAAQAAKIALRQQQVNAEAADTLAQANSLMASLNGGASGSAVAPDAAAAINSLFDTQPSNDSTVAIGALLGDSGQGAADSTVAATVNNLLAEDDPPNSPIPVDPWYQPPPIDKSYGAGLTFPMQDQQMTVDMGDSVDQPDPSMFGRMKQAIQSGVGQAEQGFKDGLNKLVAPVQSLIAPIVNDPGVQAVYHVISNGGTMPVTQATDSGDRMVNNVAGSALLTSVPIVKLTATTATAPEKILLHPKETSDNILAPGEQMSDQVEGMMGWATQATQP